MRPLPCHAIITTFGILYPTLCKSNSGLGELVHHLLPCRPGALFPSFGDLFDKLTSRDIRLSRLDERWPVDDLVAKVENSEEDQTDVGNEEVFNAPRDEGCEEACVDEDARGGVKAAQREKNE